MSSHSYLLTTNHSLLSSHSYCHLIYTYHVQLRCHPPLRFLKYVLLSSSLNPSTIYCCPPVYIPQPCTVVIQFISLNHALLSYSLYQSTMYCCHPVYINQLCTVVIQFISSTMYCCHPIYIPQLCTVVIQFIPFHQVL